MARKPSLTLVHGPSRSADDLPRLLEQLLAPWAAILSEGGVTALRATIAAELVADPSRRASLRQLAAKTDRRAADGRMNTVSDADDDEELEERMAQKARAMVDKALEPYKAALTPAELDAMRAVMEMELLVDPKGHDDLRRLVADPKLDTSDAVARDGAAASGTEASGTDGPQGEGEP